MVRGKNGEEGEEGEEEVVLQEKQEEEEEEEEEAKEAKEGKGKKEEEEMVLEEPGAGAATAEARAVVPAAPAGTTNKQSDFSTDLLRLYYARLFPYEIMFRWLSYGNDPRSESPHVDRTFFGRREWSFTIQDDIYIRYQSFADAQELRREIQKRQPFKIDIGAVFTAPPKDHNAVQADAFHTVERELVFDIDLTDYDDVRTCCSGANICQKCWAFMTMAMKVLAPALRDDFGFRHTAWIYSGRRGVHCWVSDQEARELSNDARSAVINYLDVVKPGENVADPVPIRQPFHSSLVRAYELLEPLFVRYIIPDEPDRGQGLLARKDRWTRVLRSMPDGAHRLREELGQRWESDGWTPEQRWKMLKDHMAEAAAQAAGGGGAGAGAAGKRARRLNFDYREVELWMYKTVFYYCYPRLDVNVSKHQNHLLKSPFCIHPKTGRVCVPINIDECESFNPAGVPTLRVLIDEIDHAADHDAPDLDKTSLKAYIRQFERQLLQPLGHTIQRRFRALNEQTEAETGDW